MKLVLNANKSVEENAQAYFEKAKKARKKLVGAKEVVEKFKKKYAEEEIKSNQHLEDLETKKQVNQKKKNRKKEWYEKFRWFISSEGFLVVGGRDATTNEIVIKKNTDKEDIVCHTDMAGSPFFVIKKNSNKEKEITEISIQEAIDATFAFSRAWKLGLLTSKTFYVKPEQVTKEANSGEFLPKGAFMIRGKTNYLTPRPRIAIGKYKDTVMAGPFDVIQENCTNVKEITQGRSKPSDIAKKLKKELDSDNDIIIAALPPGNSDVKKAERVYKKPSKK